MIEKAKSLLTHTKQSESQCPATQLALFVTGPHVPPLHCEPARRVRPIPMRLDARRLNMRAAVSPHSLGHYKSGKMRFTIVDRSVNVLWRVYRNEQVLGVR
jgi:hypothetical protein